MPDLLRSVEIVVVVLLGIAAAVLAFVFFRRRLIARGRPALTMCGLRQNQTGWRMGMMRYGMGALEWYALDGLTIRPEFRWEQRLLDLGGPVSLPAGDGLEGLQDPVAVSCNHRGQPFDLAMADTAYTALRSWLEAAPPGAASSVT